LRTTPRRPGGSSLHICASRSGLRSTFWVLLIMPDFYDLRSSGGVAFDPESHSYTNADGIVYTSVTTLLGQFRQKFDSDRMSRYKAIQAVLDPDEFSRLKRNVGGWQHVPDVWDGMTKDPSASMTQRLIEARESFLKKWAEAGSTARDGGTAEHTRREEEVKRRGGMFHNGVWFTFYPGTNILHCREGPPCRRVLLECLLWNHELNLSGLSDVLLVDTLTRATMKTGTIDVLDYKTNGKISTDSFQDRRMSPPLVSLPDSTFHSYSLQLRIYQRIACELTGLLPGSAAIVRTRDDERGRPEEMISCPRLEDELDRLWKWRADGFKT